VTSEGIGAITVRARTDDDFESLVELDLASARHHASLDPAAYVVPDREAVASFLRRRLDDPARIILVAEVDRAVVGTVEIRLVDPPERGSIIRPIPTADLGISVADGWRGRGVGQALMAAAEHEARRRGARRIILDMAAANHGALRFYRRLGYREVGLFLERPLVDDPS
jgi:ribosomal protein S18 acetylase RimI-like enzyme